MGVTMTSGGRVWIDGILRPLNRDPTEDFVQLGRQNGCPATIIDELTDPARCRIATAGDSSWCVTCGLRFDTNTMDGNVPPTCWLELDPIRGGRLT